MHLSINVRRTMLPALAVALTMAGGSYLTGVPIAEEAKARSSNCYATFFPSGRAVEIEACEHDGGGSGYTIMRNNTGRDMYVCWTLHFGNGTSNRGCNFRVKAHDVGESSCSSCSRQKSGGLVDVTWRKVEPSA